MVLLLGLGAADPGAQAQQPTGLSRIGLLPFGSSSNEYDRSLVEAFRLGLREIGVVENRDVALDVAWTATEADLSSAVGDLVSRGAKLLICNDENNYSNYPSVFQRRGVYLRTPDELELDFASLAQGPCPKNRRLIGII